MRLERPQTFYVVLSGIITATFAVTGWIWSEYQDSNLGPSAPKADALPDCATLRMRHRRIS